MIAVPAVDVKGGRCVQLVGGRPEDERVSLPDPLDVARHWWEAGFRTLHVVDLDAALSLGENHTLVARLCEATEAEVQVGGGLRTDEAVARVLDAGARRAVVGTRAVEDPDWLVELAATHPDRVMVAADVRDGQVVSRGWTEGTGLAVGDFLERLDELPLAGVLCTDVGREGRMAGIDLEAMTGVIRTSAHPVWISGGVSETGELRALGEAGAAGAVLGMALYTGRLDAEEVAREFGEPETSEGARP